MSQDDFKRINELIRQGGRRFDDSTELPSDDDIYACIENTATKKQLESIQKALLNSIKFRHEFKKIIQEYQEFIDYSNNLQHNSEIILPEKLRNVLKNEFSKSKDAHNSILKKVKDFFKPLQLAVGSLAIVASAIIFSLLNVSNPVLVQMTKQISYEKTELIPIVTRGNMIDTSFSSGEEAAKYGFRQYFQYDNDKDVFIPHSVENFNFITKLFINSVDLFDINGSDIGTIQLDDNLLTKDVITDIQITIIDLKTFAVFTSFLKDLKHPIQLDFEIRKSSFIVITYKINNMYFVAGKTFIYI